MFQRISRIRFLYYAWDILVYFPYSSDMKLSNYYLFQFLQNSLKKMKLNFLEAVKGHLYNFFTNKTRSFYENESFYEKTFLVSQKMVKNH